MIKFCAVIVALLAAAAMRQSPLQSYTKPYKDTDGKDYLVKYTFDARYSRVPGGDSRAPHFNAEVSVFQIVPKRGINLKPDTVAVGKPMQGVYVEAGCSDDKPAEWVRRAKNSH